jgi:uncharacterized membrane protein
LLRSDFVKKMMILSVVSMCVSISVAQAKVKSPIDQIVDIMVGNTKIQASTTDELIAKKIEKIDEIIKNSGDSELVSKNTSTIADEFWVFNGPGEGQVMKYFLGHGLNPNARDHVGTPLLMLYYTDRELVDVLLADPRIEVNQHNCVKGFFSRKRHPETTLDWAGGGEIANDLIAAGGVRGKNLKNDCESVLKDEVQNQDSIEKAKDGEAHQEAPLAQDASPGATVGRVF